MSFEHARANEACRKAMNACCRLGVRNWLPGVRTLRVTIVDDTREGPSLETYLGIFSCCCLCSIYVMKACQVQNVFGLLQVSGTVNYKDKNGIKISGVSWHSFYYILGFIFQRSVYHSVILPVHVILMSGSVGI